MLCQEQSCDPPSEKTFLTRLKMQLKFKKKKKWRESCKYLLHKKTKTEESVTFQNIFSLIADFRDVVSVLPAARLLNPSRIFVAPKKKLIDRGKSRSLSLLFDCHRSQARNIKKAAAWELIGAKKGSNFQFNLFL